MNSAFNDNHAGMRTGRLVRRAAHAALACALVCGSGLALAQQRDRDFGPAPQQAPHAERFRLPQMDPQTDRNPHQADPRAYDDARRAQPYPQPYQQQPYPQPSQQYQQDPARRSGRMTADERREMRRQINEAKDFYPQRR